MPYVLPTSDQFFTRFPIFNDQDADRIAALILEASSLVDTTWEENDYQPAIMYLTAHLLATDNTDEGDEVELGPVNSNLVSSESFGGMSISYAGGNNALASNVISTSDMYGSTVYGRRFLAMAIRNKPGMVAV